MKKLILFATILVPNIFIGQTIQLTEWITGLDQPTAYVSAGDDRMFLVEREDAQIIVYNNVGSEQGVFLDINSKVNSSPNERGLLGLAFHPDYANNGFFFVNYTNNSGNTVIERYEVSDVNPDSAVVSTGEIVLTIEQPEWNHNGGNLVFGPDGNLFIGMGDGGSGGDPDGNGQNTSVLLGKMLKIGVDSLPYYIPNDNPFVGDDSVEDEIWSIGMRNPWRYSFDSETGDMWVGDVGQNAWEEINFEPASSPGGENYGWRCYEASHVYNSAGCNGTYVDPIHELDQADDHCSVIGGYVYRGAQNSDLVGHYLYTDYCTGIIESITPDGENWVVHNLLETNTFGNVSFGEDNYGELYIVYNGFSNSKVYKITFPSNSISETSISKFSLFPNPVKNDLKISLENRFESGSIKILNTIGQEMKSLKTELLNSSKELKIDVSDLSSGIYFVEYSIGTSSTTQKFVKQ